MTAAPAIDLNTAAPGVGNGSTDCANAIALVPVSQTNLVGNTNLTKLALSYQNNGANLPDGASEVLKFDGTVTGTASYALNFTGAPANTTTSISGVSYTVSRTSSGSTNTIAFTKTSFTVAEGNALLKALRYSNEVVSPATPTAGPRQFAVNVENSAFRSPDAAFTATVNCVAISGNIFHDANGLRDGIVNSNFNASSVLPVTYAVLTNTAGTVLASAVIASNGSYSFGRNDPGTYNIYVRNAAVAVNTTGITNATYPAGGYVATGENLGATAGNDGIIDGKLTVTLGSIAVTNANFGLQIPPTATNNALTGKPNPGGFNNYAIPSGSFTKADADGILDSMVITVFPTGANYLQIGTGTNKKVYTTTGSSCPPQSACITFPATGGLKIEDSLVSTLAVDPSATVTNSTVVITYYVIDNGSARSTGTNTLSIPFTVPATPLSVSGNVWNDTNGNGTKDAGEDFTAVATTGQTLYAMLVQTTNTYSGMPTILTSVPVTAVATGYTFPNVPTGNSYEVRIASLATQPAEGTAFSNITPALATNYTGVSTNNSGTIAANQNNVNLVNILGIVTTNKTGVNFGIEQRPTADTKAFTAPNSAFTKSITVTIGGKPTASIGGNSTQLSGNTIKSLSGTDPEDCATASSCLTGKTFVINTVNPNTLVYYNNAVVTAGSSIPNFNVANLLIYGQQGQGFGVLNALGFTYSLQDAAGVASAPVVYSLQTAGAPLPIVLKGFAGTVSNCVANLRWEIASETANCSYEVEQSATGADFKTVETVLVTEEAHNTVRQANITHLSPVNYFRLKLVDERGEATYSQTVLLNGGNCSRSAISVWPNPTANRVNIDGLQGQSNTIVVYSSLGAVVSKVITQSAIETVDLSNFADGLYLIQVVGAEGTLLRAARVEKQ